MGNQTGNFFWFYFSSIFIRKWLGAAFLATWGNPRPPHLNDSPVRCWVTSIPGELQRIQACLKSWPLRYCCSFLTNSASKLITGSWWLNWLVFKGWRMVKSETRRDAETLVRNPSPRLFGKKFRDSKKVKTNRAKTRLRDLSKTLPRFRDPVKIFRDPGFSRYHSPPLI